MSLQKIQFPFLACLVSISFSLIASRASAADVVKFPADKPVFTFEVPEKWSCKPDKDGNLDCSPGEESGYFMSIVSLANVQSYQELKAFLPELAKTMADGAKLKNFEAGDVDMDTNGNDIVFTGIRGDGKAEGLNFVVVVHAFEPQKGKFFAFMTAAPEKADKKYEKDYDSITASVEAVK